MNTRRSIFTLLALATPLLAVSADDASTIAARSHYAAPWKKHGSPLVDRVRRATARYRDIAVAIGEGWVPGTPCVTGPNAGAMGVHFVLPARIGDGVLNADEPEALIYEPLPSGALRLVGVEFIVPADAWTTQNPNAGPPSLDGHLTNYVGAPNRYGLPAFYELHVWAWEKNPDGNFVDWNTMVSCDHQKAE
jgi:hypothetical protein